MSLKALFPGSFDTLNSDEAEQNHHREGERGGRGRESLHVCVTTHPLIASHLLPFLMELSDVCVCLHVYSVPDRKQ